MANYFEAVVGLGSGAGSSRLAAQSICGFSLMLCRTTGGGSQEKLSWGLRPPRPPHWSAAVAASAGQEGPSVIALVGRCRGLRKPVFGVMSRISQDQHV